VRTGGGRHCYSIAVGISGVEISVYFTRALVS
jgi:hypothetical protein